MDWLFTRPPLQSLKDIALIKTCTLLWTPIHSYKLNNFEEYRNNWLEIEGKIKENVCLVNLPKSVEEQIMFALDPIGLQVLKWIQLHDHKLPSSHLLPNKFCWAQEGTIDLKRTAEIIVKNCEIPARCRYELTLIYCLENYFQILWNEMPEVDRKDIWQDVISYPGLAIRAYWVYISTGNVNMMNLYVRNRFGSDLWSLHFIAFLEAADNVNIVAAKYFFDKLTPEEKRKAVSNLQASAVEIARKRATTLCFSLFDCESYADVLYFLMLQMSEEDQVKTFKECPLGILMCLADWPWQYNLLPTLNRMWNVIPKDDYVYLLMHLSNAANSSNPRGIHQQLFSEVWRNAPVEFKEFTVQHSLFEKIIHQLRGNCQENMKLILGSDEVSKEMKSSLLHSLLRKFLYCIGHE